MGDKEFNDFLHGQEHEREDHGTLECHKRLLYDIIQTKLSNSTDLIGIYSELMVRFPKKDYEQEIKYLKEISKQAFEQLNYLISVVIDETESSGE